MIVNNGDYTITIGDGSRTTKLTINNLDFISDAAEYKCTVMTRRDANVVNSAVYVLEFPEHVITTPDVSGYLQTGEVTLTCELHGYQSSLSPPVWLNTNGSETNDSTKYTVSVCEGNNTIILQNGTVVPSIIFNITIHNLSSADGGTYTCRGVRGESVTQLTILEGTDPNMLSQTYISTSIEGITPTPPPGNETTTRVPVMDETIVIIAAAVGSVIIVLTILILIIFIVYLLRKINKIKIRSTEAVQVPNSLSMQERKDSSISVQDVTYEEIAEKNDMLLTKNEAYVCVDSSRK
ncbi:uncharacterized protein LOC135343335 [Halichondria panicea]|uniref:uncharacterized protein LOC135343335 n=1 Tax=Halichondria panicea TaxID=6063 RepID=UPI00312B86EE